MDISLTKGRIIDEEFDLLLDRSSAVDLPLIEGREWGDDAISRLRDYAVHFLARASGRKAFLDIGAYWGSYSLYFARKKMFDEIYAFEADAYNFSQLQAQLFLNKLSFDVRCFNAPVSHVIKNYAMLRSIDHPTGNRGGVGMIGNDGVANWHSTRSLRIDDTLSIENSSVVVKIDVEGHEEWVIRGMLDTLNRNDVLMQCEVAPPHLSIINSLMEQLGFEALERVEYDSYYRRLLPT